MLVRNNGLHTSPGLETGQLGSNALRVWLPFAFAATAYLNLLVFNGRLLIDHDIYWHVVVGQWIIDHRAVPHQDPFSSTMLGAHWITSEWLSEVLYYFAFRLAGWAGPVVLAALALGLTFFLLTRLLLRRLPNLAVMILVGAAMALTAPHMLARPHVLVFPLMVLWASAVVDAAEEQRAPSLAYLPLITLWANLHGSFTFGLALLAPFAVEALWGAEAQARRSVFIQWLRFGVLATLAACITPYGPESMEVLFRLFRLGDALSKINEWAPMDFASFGSFQICLIGGLAYLLYTGLKLPPLRIIVLLAVVYQTFMHRRYVDILALVAPFFIAGPLSLHLAPVAIPRPDGTLAASRRAFAVTAVLMVVSAVVLAMKTDFTPPFTPRQAVEKMRELNTGRVLNEYYFGGYLIYVGIPPFIDGRAELYGRDFINRFLNACGLVDVADFVRLLDEYKIETTLFRPGTAAIGLLDRLDGWERVYSDDIAVVHHRRRAASEKEPGASH
ncbi:hypothetical protein FBZ96_104119 [Bradyrhizobium stylosanthis]|uniref:Uncharacterized protein n=2 Tax=Bradyrhizobium stylosanthis TaxID=1803665 RepID=A0A560DPX8_9BRAD|nr:hypothetical protein FBZ96_104119 [Bradyrhizobium stylosanthis]